MLLLKQFITKVLEYKAGLNRRIKFVCIAMCSLVMSLCSCDLHVMSLNNITIHRGLTCTAPGFWMIKHHLICSAPISAYYATAQSIMLVVVVHSLI